MKAGADLIMHDGVVVVAAGQVHCDGGHDFEIVLPRINICKRYKGLLAGAGAGGVR